MSPQVTDFPTPPPPPTDTFIKIHMIDITCLKTYFPLPYSFLPEKRWATR